MLVTWLKRILLGAFVALLVAVVVIIMVVWPPRQSGECLRPSGDCTFPVDRGVQVAVLVSLAVLTSMVGGSWIVARRRKNRLLRHLGDGA
jgi:uncharacterized iron-regulated membrane protein